MPDLLSLLLAGVSVMFALGAAGVAHVAHQLSATRAMRRAMRHAVES